MVVASVPASVIVPEEVMGDPVTDRPVVPVLNATLVTVPTFDAEALEASRVTVPLAFLK